ncbi:hypothetical protein FRACYDRAFT_233878 [Fragilariopsis cylindrus CCMP1102]|uniref:Isopenicillin N synthase-like Fe(2+) 2OG dioxygenase domain-containing protein n=1 Tax=Fragilariopsis cylindrus CCMP1102 TaxID=635003 RepID=A0A1E7G0G3_9STRA|nr:hypothetical protein FRACYDRAFT_233878 [Fragilariopsis cylindrus CCMP1102]|eukprot:OEU23703.1 hypothetical protein FRACYDRAFT_233878 [Fragilariopsis cylindrus CCMP1102]
MPRMRSCILMFLHLALILPLLSEASTSTYSAVVVDRELIGISYDDLCDLFVNDNNNGSNNNDDESNDDNDREMFLTLRRQRNMIAPLLRKIEEAFGTMSVTNNNSNDEDGDGRGSNNRPSLGFLEITDLPSDMVQLRKKLLPKASKLANLSSKELMSLERPDTGYSIGWSHGKESFRNADNNDDTRRYDTSKGSFYMNPFISSSSNDDSDNKNDNNNNDSVPAVVNVYPPSLQPHLEEDLLIMTKFMSRVGLWIAILCDLYLYEEQHQQQCEFDDDDINKHNKTYPYPSLSSFDNNEWMVKRQQRQDYFPPGQQQQQQQQQQIEEEHVDNDQVFDDWCGWHTDHGTLTALLPGMLCDEEEEEAGSSKNEKESHPKKQQSASSSTSSTHSKPGLYIQTNNNHGNNNGSDEAQQQQQQQQQSELVHVKLSPNSLGFQLGETLQIMSKGKFIATPHAVKAPPSSPRTITSADDNIHSMKTKKIGRASLAVFLQPLSNQLLPPLVDIDEESSSSSSLQQASWRSTFGEFQRVTMEVFN